ncbi:DNA-deoxyinosine glycosylase [Ruminococcus albus]|uniref:G/U mismatch-specific uracil-DNA glycosylase n=1 Tax=Ruminococcus albus TaxID=1264 RepID=A0A1I1P2H0_RUMAL|nr:DNA-deoxyinosine glycosylase [Ruminococcus albus]SFD03876.1 G/U mismatch-specific uracil-DNA glycosylase [Ruminococcus albus]
MGEYTHIIHSFEPIYNENSRVLILGSLPSVKSREERFYYGHPRNRFWKVTATLVGKPVPVTTEEKKAFLLDSRIAVWDVIAECDIIGSSDASIKNVKAADISVITALCPDIAIFANGGTASALYDRHILPITERPAVRLPSTSPANAAWSTERLTEEWKRVLLPVLFHN